jgi:hypothetical protein
VHYQSPGSLRKWLKELVEYYYQDIGPWCRICGSLIAFNRSCPRLLDQAIGGSVLFEDSLLFSCKSNLRQQLNRAELLGRLRA